MVFPYYNKKKPEKAICLTRTIIYSPFSFTAAQSLRSIPSIERYYVTYWFFYKFITS